MRDERGIWKAKGENVDFQTNILGNVNLVDTNIQQAEPFYCFNTSLILLPFHKPCSCFPSLLLPLYLLIGGPRLGRGGRRGGGKACCFLIIIGVFMVILLLIKVLGGGGLKDGEDKGRGGLADMRKARGMQKEGESGFPRGHRGIHDGKIENR